MSDTSREAVERFDPYTDEGNYEGYGNMEPVADGDWVRYSDYAALADKCAALEAQLAACDEWLKEGQTPAQRLEENHKETLALLKLLELEKRKTERSQDVFGN